MMYDTARDEQLEHFEELIDETQDDFLPRFQKLVTNGIRYRRSSLRAAHFMRRRKAQSRRVRYVNTVAPVTMERPAEQQNEILQEIGGALLSDGDLVARYRWEIPESQPLLPAFESGTERLAF